MPAAAECMTSGVLGNVEYGGLSERDVPGEFVCPISLQLMTAPVICLQTNMVYDFESIRSWLKYGGKSDPLTGIKFCGPIVLRPDLNLQQRIAEWALENNVPHSQRIWVKQMDEPSHQRYGRKSRLLSLAANLQKFMTSRRRGAVYSCVL